MNSHYKISLSLEEYYGSQLYRVVIKEGIVSLLTKSIGTDSFKEIIGILQKELINPSRRYN